MYAHNIERKLIVTTKIFAKQALTVDGWQDNVCIELNDGRIVAINSNEVEDHADQRVGILLPALSNLHSHSFQRAMAGLCEYKNTRSSGDDFWSWRNVMYQFLQQLSPEDIQSIAAQVQMEMLESGFAACAEFHYLHHAANGHHYAQLSELSLRLFAAAQETGIGYTHLPVLYTYGGLDERPLTDSQSRFSCDPDLFEQLFFELKTEIASLPNDTVLGVAPHSLRATNEVGLELCQHLCPGQPIHIHIAEQMNEVMEVKERYGAPPVEWLINHFNVDRNWCLVHATHMTEHESRLLAGSKAVAGLCPITEANLGDGIFNARAFIADGGHFGIGSDSNVRIALSEELRLLEVSQRLRDRQRVILADQTLSSNGRFIYERAALGGAQALGRPSGKIAVGCVADLVALDAQHNNLIGLRQDKILDAWIFASDDSIVKDVWAAGRHMVKDGQHTQHERISRQFKATIQRLRASI